MSANTSFLADGGIRDDNCCIANADSDFQDVDNSSYLRVTSTPRRMLQLIDTSTAARGDKTMYMEGSPA